MKLKNRSTSLQAAALSGMLAELARTGTMVTYGYLAEHLAIHPHSTKLWDLLEETVQSDVRSAKPVRACMVVQSSKKTPYNLLRYLREAGVTDPGEDFVEGQLRTLNPSGAWITVLSPVY